MFKLVLLPFKWLLLVAVVFVLGACAGPGYGPIVEDLSVQARPSERISSQRISSEGTTSVVAKPSVVKPAPAALTPIREPQPQPVVVTAQGVESQVIESQIIETTKQPVEVVSKNQNTVVAGATSLPASDQMVVEQLLREADELKAQGKVTQAIIQLQRAQRIAPRDPKVYARLAALQLSLGEASRAEQLALKGLTLVPNQNNYQYYFWKLIGASRSHLGDSAGVSKAIAQAAKYK